MGIWSIRQIEERMMAKQDDEYVVYLVDYEYSPKHDVSIRMKILLVALAPAFLSCLVLAWALCGGR